MKTYTLDGEIAAFDYHSEDGFWSFCGPKSLKAFLADLKSGEKATIEINSPGGSVIYGVEMANAIKNSKAHLVAHITGMAASMASVIACACDEIVMEEASFMMIHDPWTYAEGNAEEMRKQADILDQMKSLIMSFYRGKFKRCTDEELAKLMSAETYMTANECFDAGLDCSVVKSDVRYAAKLTSRDMAKAPEAVRAMFKSAPMPDDVKAEIEAAKAAAAAEEPEASAPTATDEGGAEPAADPAPVTPAEPEPAPAKPAEPTAANDTASDWEARYKGASKKINELQAHIADLEKRVADAAIETVDYGAVVKERDRLVAENALLEEAAAKAAAAILEFKSQLEKSAKDLDDANTKASSLAAKLEQSERDLVQSNQQLDHLRKTRDLLTGGVLTPTEGTTYAARMAKAKTPEEREKLRAEKRAGKIK